MIIRRDEVIAGRAASDIRRLLREIGSRCVDRGFVQEALGCSVSAAVRLLCTLQRAGYLSSSSGGKKPCFYSRTMKGNRLANASLRPISRATANRILRDFVQRVRMVNSNPSFLHTITSAVVFGSAVSAAEKLGDVDVAVRLERKIGDWERSLQLTRERVWQAERRGKQFRNITEQIYWPELEIWKFLKSRTRQLSIHELDELTRLPEVKYGILLGERRALAELLPTAKFVPQFPPPTDEHDPRMLSRGGAIRLVSV